MTATALRQESRLAAPLDVERIRADFPILSNVKIDGKPLVFLDNAASSQMPQPVIDRIVHYRSWEHANIHRGVHYLSETATAAYENARRIAQRFLNAGEEREVIFTSNCTDGINLVAHGYGRKFIGAGDEIILTHLEHHANIVPWQMLVRGEGRAPPHRAGDRRRRAPARRVREALQPAHEVRRRSRTSRMRSARSIRSRR